MADGKIPYDWMEDQRDFFRLESIQYLSWVNHLIENGGLHDEWGCAICDLIRVRPTRARLVVASNQDTRPNS